MLPGSETCQTGSPECHAAKLLRRQYLTGNLHTKVPKLPAKFSGIFNTALAAGPQRLILLL
jgi:hypothetical protein